MFGVLNSGSALGVLRLLVLPLVVFASFNSGSRCVLRVPSVPVGCVCCVEFGTCVLCCVFLLFPWAVFAVLNSGYVYMYCISSLFLLVASPVLNSGSVCCVASPSVRPC